MSFVVAIDGPAGTGKTMVAEQLSMLTKLPFGAVSCSMGMSESQLTGWLLPVGDNGRFDYVSSPFINAILWYCDWQDGTDINWGMDTAFSVAVPFAWMFALFEIILLYCQ